MIQNPDLIFQLSLETASSKTTPLFGKTLQFQFLKNSDGITNVLGDHFKKAFPENKATIEILKKDQGYKN